MTTTVERTYPQLAPAPLAPLRTRMGEPIGHAWQIRWRGAASLAPVLAVAAFVHARGMANYPRWVDDPGTYLSQAWAVQYEQVLSPYTYFYDHAPAGWIQIAAWSALTGGLDRYDTAIAFGSECMLLAKLASVVLLYWLGRRLHFARPAAAAVGLLFALSPLALTYTRWTFLDNLVTPWVLLAFALALSRRRTMAGAIGAGLAFGMAALTKETSLLLFPAFGWALVQNADRRNRAHVLMMAVGLSVLLMSSYLVYAIAKGELLPGPGHTSLLGTAVWQLSEREASGSVLDAGSRTFSTTVEWLRLDPYLPLAGLAAIPVAMFARRLRPAAACLLLESVVLIKGGYVPAMQVVAFLPWCALVLVGALELLRGNPALRADPAGRDDPTRRDDLDRRDLLALRQNLALLRERAPGTAISRYEPATQLIPVQRAVERDPPTAPIPVIRASSSPGRWLRRGLVAVLVVGSLLQVGPAWGGSLSTMTSVAQPPELAEATIWVKDNVPRTSVVVVHDAIWTDLVHHLGFAKDDVIMAYKLDADPAVHDRLTRLDYLVVPDWYYTAQVDKYPTLLEARDHAVAEARFGTGPDAVTVWRVSRGWHP